ncbi:MAG: MFS transporter [Armatimonadota bacterium]|nr:MFS transporter [Armatimonadota bacterium]
MRRRSQLLLLALGHGVTDTYSNFLPGFIFFLSEKLRLTNTQVGLLATVVSIAGSISQLLYGYMADRVRRPYFIVLGPAAAALFMSLLGTAGSVWTLVLLLILGGSGVACFHPQAAMAAGSGHPRRRGFELAIFITAGTAGYSIGPLVATRAAQWFGLERAWVAAIPGLLAAGVLYFGLHRSGKAAAAHPTEQGASLPPPPGASESDLPTPRQPDGSAPQSRLPLALGFLWAIVSLRAAVGTGLVHFMPLFLKGRGHDAGYASVAVSLYLLTGAAGGMLGGPLSDRWGRRRVLLSSLFLSTPPLLALTLVSPRLFWLMLVLSGFILSLSATVNVAMAQEIAPGRQGTASAIVQGLAFGTGGLLAVLMGWIADQTSIGAVYRGLAFIPLLTVPVAVLLPETVRARP